MTTKKESPTKHTSRFIFVLIISITGIIASETALTAYHFGFWIKVLLALAHVPFTILVATYGWQLLMSMDEFQRLIHMQSFVFGITAAAAYLLTSNLLYAAEIGNDKATWMFWPMLVIFYSIRYKWLKKTYQG